MKKLLLSFAFVCSIFLNSNAQVLGEPIVTWDFANGIPFDWTTGINSTTDLAHWEYRGPSTTPDYTIGARGSCSGLAQPINSTTQSNGFVIFDGNYWDDSGTSCGAGIGTGVDPGPHTAWLITPSVDLSQLNGAVLTFQQQYRSYQATTMVDISTDNGNNWTNIINNAGVQSANTVWASADISSYVAGQTSVQFRFIYTGFYYWWLIDDITIYEPNDNDLIISGPRYTTHTEGNFETAYLDLEYDQYPTMMIPPFSFAAVATNVGYNTQNNSMLNIRIVQDETTEIYNQNSASNNIPPSGIQPLQIQPPYQNEQVVGDYEIFYSLQQAETDETPLNNIDSLDYSITPFTYARDEGEHETGYMATGLYDEFRMEGGCFFEAFNSGVTCHSIQVAVAEGTAVGSGVYGIIYNQAMGQILATTDTVTVDVANINHPGEERMITLHLPEPFELTLDSVYFVAVSQADSAQAFSIARSGHSIGETGLIRFPSVNATFITPILPMVRMNLFPGNAQTGCTNSEALNYDPSATVDDGGCLIGGCSDTGADNYNPLANIDDGSCVVGGCFDPEASNYNPEADYDNGSCTYPGCTDPTAVNFDPIHNLEDGSCTYLFTDLEINTIEGCYPYSIHVSNLNEFVENSSCNFMLNDSPINTSCEAEFNYVIEDPGTYVLTYTFMVNNAVADTTITIEVLDHPQIPTLVYDANTFEVNCSNCGSNDYLWFFEEEQQATVNSPLPIFFNDNYQNGYYSLSVTDENGCSSMSTELLVVQPAFMTNVSEACAPLTLTALNLSDEFAGTTYTINFGDNTGDQIFDDQATHTYETDGQFDVVVTAENSGVEGSFTIPVIVHPILIPALDDFSDIDGTVICTNCDQFESVEWIIDGVIQTGNGPFSSDGNIYTVTGITDNGCAGSATLLINGIEENVDSSVELYPVPANQFVFVNSKHLPISRFAVYDLQGKRIDIVQTMQNGLIRIDTSDLGSGLYTMVITSDNHHVTKKFTVVH